MTPWLPALLACYGTLLGHYLCTALSTEVGGRKAVSAYVGCTRLLKHGMLVLALPFGSAALLHVSV